MMKVRLLIFSLMLVVAFESKANTNCCFIDLATESPGTKTLPIKPGMVNIIVKNGLLDFNEAYKPKIVVETIPIEPLDSPDDVKVPFPTDVRKVGIVGKCPDLQEKLGFLRDASSSKKNQSIKAEQDFVKAWNAFEEAECDNNEAEATLRQEAEQYRPRNTALGAPFELEKGQKVTVILTRTYYDEKDEKKEDPKELEWKFVYTTGSRGSWHGSFGFMVIPNDDEEYFTQADGTGSFTITKKSDHGGLKPAIGAFFTWVPSDQELKDWVNGPTAGLGLAKEELLLFAGWNWTYNRNLGLNLGAVANQQKRLSGEYTEGQTVSENLSSDALSENVYKISPFAGITFRF